MHDQAFFDQRRSGARRVANVADHLLDHELDVGPTALVAHDLDVLQADEGLEDLNRVARTKVLLVFRLTPQA